MRKILNRVYSNENFRILWTGLKRRGPGILVPILRTKFSQWFEPEQPAQLPLILHVETTSRCNLRCPSCAHAEKGGVGEDMTLDQYKKFIDQFPYVAKVILYGIGETLMHRDVFEMVRYSKAKGIYCGFFTNGTLLTERNREAILENGQDYLNISIDGPTKESFERQRAGANYEKVMANVKAMTALVRERKHPIDLAVWNCLTSENVHELPDLVRLTADLGISKLMVQDIMFWNSDGIEKSFADKTMNVERTRREAHFQEATREAKRLGVQLNLLMSAGDGKRRCQVPWYFSYVTAKGEATPCNWHGWDASLTFGNVFTQPFSEIWKDPKYIHFRNEMKADREPDFCKKCPMYDREMIRLA
jgi:radical SAM protein with 4Fe4S-binding SPASM domain